MAAFDPANAVVKTDVDGTEGFVPALWSDEIIAAYKSNLVMAPRITRINHVGKKGDTLYIPKPLRGTAAAKVEADTVTLQAHSTNTQVTINLNKHYEYSRLIEDLVKVQALDSLRMFYTDDAGYALAKQVDTDIVQTARSSNGGVPATDDYATAAASTNAYIGDGTTVYNSSTSNASDWTDAGLRAALERLDNADVPMDGRSLVVPPSQKSVFLGMGTGTTTVLAAGFSRADTTGDAQAALRTGLIGDIYGTPVYVTTNADTGAGNTATDRISILFHKEWMALAEQMNVRTQNQYMQQYLADLMTADTIYGVGELRDDACTAFAHPA